MLRMNAVPANWPEANAMTSRNPRPKLTYTEFAMSLLAGCSIGAIVFSVTLGVIVLVD